MDDGEDRSVLGRPGRPPDDEWRFRPGPDGVADVYRPAGPRQGDVVLVHGGFWRSEYDRHHLRAMATALASVGYLVLLPEYRREPGRPDLAVTDLRQVLATTGSTDGPGLTNHPVLVGHSAGGHLALLLAADPEQRAAGCLALAPVADLAAADEEQLDGGAVRDFLGGPAASRRDLDPALGPPPAIPVRIVHGERDALVPLRLSQRYASATGTPLLALPDAGHFELIDPDSTAWPTVLSELASLAGPRVLND